MENSGAAAPAPEPLRGGPGPRRSGRIAAAPPPPPPPPPATQDQEANAATTPSPHRHHPAKASASTSFSRQDSDTHQDGDASSKKRKRITRASYIRLFKMAPAPDVAVASPDIAGKENTSSGHVPGTNIHHLSQGSPSVGKNNESRSSDATVPQVSKLDDTLQKGDVVAASPDDTSSGHVADTNIHHLSQGSASIGTNKSRSSDAVPQVSKLDDTQQKGDVAAASPTIAGKENTSSGHVADINIHDLSQGSASIGKNERRSSNAVPQVSKLDDTQQKGDVAAASPTIAGKENTSSGHVADINIHDLSQGSASIGKNERRSSNAVPQVSKLDDTQQKGGVEKLMSTPKNLHVRLKRELSKLIKVLQLPDNVRLVAYQLFEYILDNHQVVTEPVWILHTFNIALCWRAASLLDCKVDRRELLALAKKSLNCEFNEDLVALMYRKLRNLNEKKPYTAGETIKGQPVLVEDIGLSWQETSTNLENDHMFQNKEMDLHGNCTNSASQEISTVAEQIFLETQEPVQKTRRECHIQNDEIPSMIVEKSIDLVDKVFSLRGKTILCKQQLEISGLVTHRENNVIRLKEVCSLVLEYIHRSHIDEMTRQQKIKLATHWFTMLMYAFLEHMKLQHEKLEGLQSDTWSSERQLKENLHQVAKSGKLDQDFDQCFALPDSNFVMEEFIHFKEQNDEYRAVESSLTHCRQSPNATLLMETTIVRNEFLSEPIPIHAMESEPVATSVASRGGLSSEAVGVQSAVCSSSTGPSNDDSIGQEASTSECRNTEHIKINSIVKPSMLLGGAISLVGAVNSNNDDTIDTAGNHFESLIYAASQSFTSLVGAQSILPCMSPPQSTDLSAQQKNVAPSRCPPVEAEHTGLLDLAAQAVQDLQPEMQPSILFPDAPLQKMPDGMSQTGVQPDRAIGLPQEASKTSLHLGDARMQGQGKSDGSVAVDPVLSESPTYPADSQITIQVSATQSTCSPAQQSILGTEAASDLQPEVQPSTSMKDEPEGAVDEPAEAERAATLGAIAAQDLQPELQSSTSRQDVPLERTYLSGMPVIHSPTIRRSVEPSLDPRAGAEPVVMVLARDLQSETLPSVPVPAKQNTSLIAQQSLATSHHSPAEAAPADILDTEPARHLQPLLGEVDDPPAEEQSCILGAIAARNLQPETRPSTSTQSTPFERTHLFAMPVLQSLTVHHTVETSLDPHARAESTHTLGSLTPHVLQREVQPSTSMQDRPAEAEGAVMLCSTAAEDLQAELQSLTQVQHVPLERIRPEERRQIGFQPNMVPDLEQPTQHPPVTVLAVNNLILSEDRLKTELDTLMQCKSLLSKEHEHKKTLLVIECNQQIAEVKKKYASLLQKEESTYLQTQRDLTDRCREVSRQKSLAESFREQITLSAAARGRSTSPVTEQPFESSSGAEPSSRTAQPQSICHVPTPVRTGDAQGNGSRLNWILGRREKAGPRRG